MHDTKGCHVLASNKPWVTPNLKVLLNRKKRNFSSGDTSGDKGCTAGALNIWRTTMPARCGEARTARDWTNESNQFSNRFDMDCVHMQSSVELRQNFDSLVVDSDFSSFSTLGGDLSCYRRSTSRSLWSVHNDKMWSMALERLGFFSHTLTLTLLTDVGGLVRNA